MDIKDKTLVRVYYDDIKDGIFIIPDGIKKIGNCAFKYCTSLQSILIPDSVEEIGERAFDNCTSLQSILIPDSVEEIGERAFYNCISLKEITLSNSVKEIGESAFSGCTSLKDVTISNNVEKIKNFVFYNCASLQNITIPSSVKKIKERAFYNCSSLQSIVLPNSVKEIGESAFSGCIFLKEITLSNSVKEIGERAFSYCQSLQSITIPNSVEKIGKCAFDNCISLQSILIPDSIKKIEERVFYNCISLKEITLSNSVKEIGERAFYNCTSLKDVTVSSSLTNMTVDSFDSSSIQNFIVYGQKLNINKNNFSSELNKIREKELLDKIILYLINRGILDEKHYKRDVHKKFINEILAEYKNNNEYHYKDDFDKYMEEYINKNNLKKHDEQIDENLKTLNDNIVNHNIEELNPNSSIDIVNYGDELVKNIYKIEEIVSIIPINYGPTNTFLEKEINKFKNPRNISQYIESLKSNENVYLGKNSINLLIYCTTYNIYRLNLGIKKLNELENTLKIYIEKLSGYKDNLLNYKVISIDSNELNKNDDILIQSKISKKANSYDSHLILVKDLYSKVENLINYYKIYINKLKNTNLLLEKIKKGEQINKGIINDKESVESLNEILNFYESIEESNIQKK